MSSTILMSSTMEKLRSRGYWHTVIRPAEFQAKRVADIAALPSIIEKASVHLRGWDFPHVVQGGKYERDVDWVGQESEWGGFLEAWRAYQSGQFVDYTAMEEDWASADSFSGGWGARPPEKFLRVRNAIFTLTEILEFASRLSLTPMGAEQIVITVVASDLAKRQLWINDNRPPRHRVQATLTEMPFEINVRREELIGNAWGIALRWSSELLKRFGMEVSDDSMRAWQEELKKFRM